MAVLTDIADAVVAELNAATFSQPVSATRRYVPVFDLKEMKTLHVTVVPKGLVIQGLSRGLNQHDYEIDVGVQKKLTSGDAEIDALLSLVEEIADAFRLRRLTSYPNAHWVKTENSPVYSPEHADELRQFTSVLTLTFRVAR